MKELVDYTISLVDIPRAVESARNVALEKADKIIQQSSKFVFDVILDGSSVILPRGLTTVDSVLFNLGRVHAKNTFRAEPDLANVIEVLVDNTKMDTLFEMKNDVGRLPLLREVDFGVTVDLAIEEKRVRPDTIITIQLPKYVCYYNDY